MSISSWQRLSLCVCEAVGEVRGCEGEGYPTASKRKRKKRGGALLHVGGKKKGRDEKWMINEWLCSPEGLSSVADEELTGKSQLGTGLFHLFAFSVFIPITHHQFLDFLSLHQPFVLFLSLFRQSPVYLTHSLLFLPVIYQFFTPIAP